MCNSTYMLTAPSCTSLLLIFTRSPQYDCWREIRSLFAQIVLKLNSNETGFLLVGYKSALSKYLKFSVTTNDSTVSSHVNNLGVILCITLIFE